MVDIGVFKNYTVDCNKFCLSIIHRSYYLGLRHMDFANIYGYIHKGTVIYALYSTIYWKYKSETFYYYKTVWNGIDCIGITCYCIVILISIIYFVFTQIVVLL